MRMFHVPVRALLAVLIASTLAVAAGAGQAKQPPDPGKAIAGTMRNINKQILDMAEDFPAEKYGFRAKPEVRSFGEVIVHAMSGTEYAAKAGRGENVQWTELDPKNYKDKAAIVTALKSAIADCDATLKATPAARFASSPEPWLSVIEHTAEHYGQLVVYYRLNGMVPPASRPKK
jgi:uncharacterized damage-inducible protein DinB